jgi:hypothetical protein
METQADRTPGVPISLRLGFELRDLPGWATVTVEPNKDPLRWGYGRMFPPADLAFALGFPVCRATVRYAGEGYLALMGWVQLVCTGPPGRPVCEFDPLLPFADLDLPYAFFGIAPELFDLPSREQRTTDLVWQARSFLCAPTGSLVGREIGPVTAFSWGFELREARVLVKGPAPLPLTAWNEHVDALQRSCPSWRFRHV